MLQAKPKYSLQCSNQQQHKNKPGGLIPPCKKSSQSDQSTSNMASDYNAELTPFDSLEKKKKLWSVSPSSFHQSFDDRLKPQLDVPECLEVSNSCGDINQQMRTDTRHQLRRSGFCPGDTGRNIPAGRSTLNTPSCSSSQQHAVPAPTRPHVLGGKSPHALSPQSSFDSNGDVGQISLGFLRMNGAIAPFKTLLNSDLYGNTQSPHGSHPQSPAVAKLAHAPFAMDASLEGGSCHRLATAATAAATSSPGVIEYVIRRKESWSSSAVDKAAGIKTGNLNEGDGLSKKSISLVSNISDLEQQKLHDDSKIPLVKEKEKGGRLIQRQRLFHVRRVTSDYALIFSLLGIVLMVIENELTAEAYEKSSLLSLFLRTLILLSTVVLLVLVAKFHIHEVQLFMNANSAEDWRIAVTPKRFMQLALELLACGICPLPINLSFEWITVHADGETVTRPLVPLDVLLSIPMFFRLYWVCRVMLLHSRLFTDASSRSIAGLNRVNFNARFILKTLMTLCPGTMLMVFTASLWIVAGWIMRLCERPHGGYDTPQATKHQNYLNSLWLIAITFLSVGYGDIVPNTYCGRIMAVVTGILGTCTSSMVVAVIARKLELTRAEKHVHNFMMDTQLTKQLKHSAANVLRETWLIYKHRRLMDKIDTGKIRHHQRKFLVAICALRKVKHDQRKLAENTVSLGDVAKTLSSSYEIIHDIFSTQEGLALRITSVEHTLSDIQKELGGLTELLRASLKYKEHEGSAHKSHHSNGGNSMSDSLRRRKYVMEPN